MDQLLASEAGTIPCRSLALMLWHPRVLHRLSWKEPCPIPCVSMAHLHARQLQAMSRCWM